VDSVDRIQRAKKSLLETLDKLDQIKAQDLSRKDELGTALCFEDAVPVLERTLSLFRRLRGLSLDDFPQGILAELASAAGNALDSLQQIREFQVAPFDPRKYRLQEGTPPEKGRDALVERVLSSYDDAFAKVAPAIAYATPASTQFAAMRSELARLVDEARKAEEQRAAEREGERKEAQDLLGVIRGVAGEAGVAQHAVHFQEQSVRYGRVSLAWLLATVITGICTAVTAWRLFHSLAAPPGAPLAQVVQGTALRLVILSVFWFGLVWSARNYGANQHNAVVNRHRHNALKTFETFVKATGDPETKDAVLLQATQCIFLPQSSGYLGREPDAHMPTNIIEVARHIVGEQKQ